MSRDFKELPQWNQKLWGFAPNLAREAEQYIEYLNDRTEEIRKTNHELKLKLHNLDRHIRCYMHAHGSTKEQVDMAVDLLRMMKGDQSE